MQFALILLLVLAAACAFGSFITQGQTLSWYTTAYGERAAAAIMLLSMLVPEVAVPVFPFMVSGGAALFMALSILFFH